MDVCLLLEDETVLGWQADAVSYLLEHSDVDVTAVVYNEYEHHRSPLDVLRRGVELREWGVVGGVARLLNGSTPLDRPVDLDAVLDRDSVVEYAVEPTIVDGWKQAIPAEAVEAIASEADLAIRFGFGFLVGPILSAFKYGVLSYHHGDIRTYRGQPMGFWEFVDGEPTAGITVQQLTETLDGGRVAALKTVDIDDLRTWEAVRTRLYRASEDMLVTAVQTVRDGEAWEAEALGPLYTHPRGRAVLRFAVKEALGRLGGGR